MTAPTLPCDLRPGVHVRVGDSTLTRGVYTVVSVRPCDNGDWLVKVAAVSERGKPYTASVRVKAGDGVEVVDGVVGQVEQKG